MEQKLALASCLALQHNDSKLNNIHDHNALIAKTLSLIILPDLVADGDGRAALIGVKHLIQDVCNGEMAWNLKLVLHKLRVICAHDSKFYDAFVAVLDDEAEELVIRNNVNAFVSQLRTFVNGFTVKKAISKASYNLNSSDGETTLRDVVKSLQEELGRFNTTNTDNGERPGFVGRVTTDDDDGFEVVFDNTKKMLEGSVLKTGWKGINRMMGVNGGVVPGEVWVMPALPHNAKTTFSLSLFLSLAIFNDAHQFVEEERWKGLKPMLLDISLENELEVNLPIAYKMVYEHFEQTSVDIRKIDSKAAGAYITSKLKEHGWHVSFERYNSTEFTIETLRDIVNSYEAAGYRIVACRCDYLGVSNKNGLSNGAVGSEVREMYRRSRNIAAPKKMALISPHQLSPAAKAARAMDEGNFVKNLPGKGFYDGCTSVDNEVDGELFFGITKDLYLEIQRGKHRTIIDTPIKDRYGVLKFDEIGTLPWDLDSDKDVFLKSINADSQANEEEFEYDY